MNIFNEQEKQQYEVNFVNNPVGKYSGKNRLSNGMKVFLTTISVIIPGLGQLAGIIIAILFMNDEEDEDRRSFGIALLVASLVFFVLSCFFWFIVLLVVFTARA